MRQSRWLGALFLLPGSLILAALFVIPMALVVVYSFGTINVVGLPQLGFTTVNYHDVFEPFYVPTLVRTVEYAGLTTIICIAARLSAGVLRDALRRALGQVHHRGDHSHLGRRLPGQDLCLDGDPRLPTASSTPCSSTSAIGRQDVHPQHHGRDRRARVRLPAAHDPAHLRVAGRSRLGADRRRQGSLRQSARRRSSTSRCRPRPAGVVGGALLTFFPSLGDFATAQFLGGPNQSMIGNLISQQFTGHGLDPVRLGADGRAARRPVRRRRAGHAALAAGLRGAPPAG